jgi:hypothetical protein
LLAAPCAALSIAVAALPAGASLPTSQSALNALPGQIVSALYAHDVATVRAMCDARAIVVDEFPPFLWTGPDACARYANAFAAVTKHVNVTAFTERTRSTTVTRAPGRILVVTHVTRTPYVAGDAKPEDGTWTFVLTRSARGWTIASLTWSALQ